MRAVCVLFAVFVLLAQEKSSSRATYTIDPNGHRVLDSQRTSSMGPSGKVTAESVQTLNGRMAPLQQVEERTISDGPGGKVVERIIRRYEGSGGPASTEKIVIENRKNPDGSSTVRTTSYDADLNGRFTLRERETETSSRQGAVERAETVVERPTLSGTFQTAEKRQSVTEGPENDRKKDVTTYRITSSGTFGVAQRSVDQVRILNGETTSTSVTYDANSTGILELATQRVATVRKAADGSEVEVVDLYGKSQPGRAAAGGPALREQQVIERRASGGQTIESVSIRRPQLDSGKLGPLTKVSETVCTGECKPTFPF
jgi:hypothetical protein